MAKKHQRLDENLSQPIFSSYPLPNVTFNSEKPTNIGRILSVKDGVAFVSA